MHPYNRFQYRPNAFQQYQPQAGGLPWQVGRVPRPTFQAAQQSHQNVVVGDGVAVGRPQVQPQRPQYLRHPLEPLVSHPNVAAQVYQIVDGWKMVPVEAVNASHGPSPAEILNSQRRENGNSQGTTAKQEPQIQYQPFERSWPADMGNRQLRYDSLTKQEQKEQDEWAMEYIAQVAPCPKGLPWIRLRRRGRYICTGLMHVITDRNIYHNESCQLSTKRDYIEGREQQDASAKDATIEALEKTGKYSKRVKELKKEREKEEKKKLKKRNPFFF